MSFNVLAPSLVLANRWLYRHTPRRFVDDRTASLLRLITALRCDVVCLQELEQGLFEGAFTQALSEHAGVYMKRTGDQLDGVAVFVNKDRFEIVHAELVEYAKLAAGDRDNVAVVCLLACKRTGRRTIVANTHLLWNPKRGDIKLLQMQALLDAVARVQDAYGDAGVPAVFVGDFNMVPNSMLYNYVVGADVPPESEWHAKLISGQRRPSEAERVMLEADIDAIVAPPNPHAFWLASAYAPHTHSNGDSMASTWHQGGRELVDFVFYGSRRGFGIGEDGPHGIRLESLLNLPESTDMRMLPNRFHPSDHLPLVVQFQLLPRKK
ncbi:Protein angel 2 [Polyrhizophydium stewartii]|uniref:Protein angel 2 n=1 Tax=Polyrhizophydium stewartii TaxID=2732419 RepID=A0ABR4NAU9_9FUNG|nr:Protein angel 2 [Polyrhizophydium stewartii]